MSSRGLDSVLEKLKISRKDVTAFTASLLLAFGIWLLYNLNLSYSATLSADVYAFTNLPGRFQKSSEPVLVEARCRATGYEMLHSRRSKKSRAVVLQLDPELFVPEGDGAYSLSSTVLSARVGELFGNGARLESFTSPTYVFKFAPEANKTVPVVSVTSLSFKPQYMQKGAIRLDPDSVMVYGDPSFLENVDRIYTSRLSLSGLSSPKSGYLKLEKPRSVRLSTDETRYELDVIRYVEVKRSAAIQLRNVPAGKELNSYPSTVELSLRCAFPYTVDRTDELQIYVDYKDFVSSSDGKCAVRTGALPQGIISVKLMPEVVECVEETR